MKLPEIPKDQLPENIQEQIEGDTASFEPLGESDDAMRHVRQKKSESEMRRTLGELESLNKLFKFFNRVIKNILTKHIYFLNSWIVVCRL